MSKKVYIVGPNISDFDSVGPEYDATANALGQKGYAVCFSGRDGLHNESEQHLRGEIAQLMQCEAICLMDYWWTSRNATCLQTIAAWLRFEVLDSHADLMPTSSLRG